MELLVILFLHKLYAHINILENCEKQKYSLAYIELDLVNIAAKKYIAFFWISCLPYIT